MAINAYFYKFAKDDNSTELPFNVPSSDRVFYQIELKAPTNISAPVLIINSGSAANPTRYNYVNIPDFNRFYWISGWTYAKGLWIASCTVDVLASYRTEIGDSSQYITRASNDFDGSIVDTLYPIKSGLTVSNIDIQWGWTGYADGCFIVGIVNDDSTSHGGTVSYYVMDRAALAQFATYLMTNPQTWLNIPVSEISNELAKALVNPTEYVVSVKWIPISAATLPKTAITTLKFGFYTVAVTGGVYRLNATASTKTISNIAIQKHPQSARGDYLNNAPYAAYVLHFPPFGDMPLDSALMVGATTLSMRVDMDFATTSAVLTVWSNKGDLQSSEIMKARTTIGVDVRMDKIGYDVTNQNFGFYMLGQGAISLLANMTGASTPASAASIADKEAAFRAEYLESNTPLSAISDYIAPAVSNALAPVKSGINKAINAASGIVSAYGASLMQVHSAGSVGSWAEYYHPSVYIQCAFALIADEAELPGEEIVYQRGRPLCKMKNVSTLGGYMEVSDPHIAIAGATAPEIEAVKAAMSSGFWFV